MEGGTSSLIAIVVYICSVHSISGSTTSLLLLSTKCSAQQHLAFNLYLDTKEKAGLEIPKVARKEHKAT